MRKPSTHKRGPLEPAPQLEPCAELGEQMLGWEEEQREREARQVEENRKIREARARAPLGYD